MLLYFNKAGAGYNPAVVGIELSTISEARIEAVKFAAETLRERPELIWLGDEFRVEVTDENQLLLFTVIAFGVDAPAASGR